MSSVESTIVKQHFLMSNAQESNGRYFRNSYPNRKKEKLIYILLGVYYEMNKFYIATVVELREVCFEKSLRVWLLLIMIQFESQLLYPNSSTNI